jgi:uncharacterized protein (DUF1684 family)
MIRVVTHSRPYLILFLILTAGVGAGCRSAGARGTAPANWRAWQAERRESLGGTNGWLTLVGLHWLGEGSNSAGSDLTNQIVLPDKRVPDHLGQFIRSGRTVKFEAAAGVPARVAGQPVQTATIRTDRESNPTRLESCGLVFTVIERGDRIGLRVRDPESPARRQFRGVKYFPYDDRWCVVGRFEGAVMPQRFRVPDVTGSVQEYASPGVLVFEHGKTEHRLVAASEPGTEDLFIMFRDETAGTSTYPAGRFLYVRPADSKGKVILDFNRAYSPPCAFTDFATCPLPPPQNRLPFPIRAGELAPASNPRPH